MRRISGRLTVGPALLVLVAACNPDKPVELRSPALDRIVASVAPLVLHVVAPQTTDPAIDQALDDHYVWLDTTARSNQKLFVFLPGTGQNPSIFQLVQREAARLGYHVIGLMYPTGGGLAKVCPTTPDPSACYEDARLEIIDGIDRVAFLNVNVANSIDNRLTKLLQYLTRQYPDEGWDRFLLRDGPKWSQIAVGGHSQGGGNAAMLAKIRLVARVVLFSSVTDSIHTEAPSWVATHVTPTDRYYGIAHDRDGFYRPIRAGWDSLALDAFGAPATPETSSPPYGGTHTLVTDLTPQGGFVGTSAHGAPSNDLNTPLGPDGTPRLLDAWRYLLTARASRDDEGEESDASDAPTWSAWSAPVNLGPVVNSPFNDNHPAISKDGLSLYITSGRPGGVNGVNAGQFEEIWFSQRASPDADWGPPVNLGPAINIVGSNTGSPTFTPDGHRMYFHSNRPGGCGLADLYTARRHDTRDDFGWGPPENLGCVVNGPSNDNGPTYFEDENTGITTLYFTSTRTGGPGDFDIYASTRVGEGGEFGPPVLVAELSAPGRDTRTAIRRDGLEMFLSSDGTGRAGGIGSQDIWVSTRATTLDPWSTPVNLGPTVNSTAFDGAPALSFDATTLYFFSERAGGFGKRDLYVTKRQRINNSAAIR
jgi:WD40 repeat protein